MAKAITTKGTELKKSKPVKIERNQKGDYQSQNGLLYSFLVEMENGDKGEYKAKDQSKLKFVINELAEYFVDVVTPDDGSESYKIYKIRPNYDTGNFKGGGYKRKPMTPEEQFSIIKQVVFSKNLELQKELLKAKIAFDEEIIGKLRSDSINKLSAIVINADKTVNESLGQLSSSAMKITYDVMIVNCLKQNNSSPISTFEKVYDSILESIKP